MHAHTLYLIARYFMAVMFFMSAFGKLKGRKEALNLMQSHHLPMVSLGLSGAVVLEIAGVICLVFGFFLIPILWLLLLFLVAVTLVVPVQDIAANHGRPQALQLFGSNVAIIGGVLALIAYTHAGA